MIPNSDRPITGHLDGLALDGRLSEAKLLRPIFC